MAELENSEQMQVRLDKAAQLQAAGIDPYGESFVRTHTSTEILNRFEELEGSQATVAGRIMAIRGHGKACFIVLADKEYERNLVATISVNAIKRASAFR